MTSPAPHDEEFSTPPSTPSPSLPQPLLPLPEELVNRPLALEPHSEPILQHPNTPLPLPACHHDSPVPSLQQTPPSPPPPSPSPVNCTICYETLSPSTRALLAPCAHSTFCTPCITHWISRPQNPQTCPLCRTGIASINDGAVPIPQQPEESFDETVQRLLNMTPPDGWPLVIDSPDRWPTVFFRPSPMFSMLHPPVSLRWPRRRFTRPWQVQPPWRGEEGVVEEDDWVDVDEFDAPNADDAPENQPEMSDHTEMSDDLPEDLVEYLELVAARRAFHARAREGLAWLQQRRQGL